MRERLLDTDIFSEILRGQNLHVRTRARGYEVAHSRLVTSAITVMEIVKGYQRVAHQRELDEFPLLLPSLRILPFDHDEAEVAGRIYGDLERTGRIIGRADPMIASVAIVRGAVLVRATQSTTRTSSTSATRWTSRTGACPRLLMGKVPRAFERQGRAPGAS